MGSMQNVLPQNDPTSGGGGGGDPTTGNFDIGSLLGDVGNTASAGAQAESIEQRANQRIENNLPAVQRGLRDTSAATGTALLPNLSQAIEGAAGTRVSRIDELEEELLRQAEQTGALSTAQANEIRDIARNTGRGIEQVSRTVLGENGLQQTLRGLAETVPGVVTPVLREILQTEQDIQGNVQPFQDVISQALGGVGARTGQAQRFITDAAGTPTAVNQGITGVAPAGFEQTLGTYRDLASSARDDANRVRAAAASQVDAARKEFDLAEQNAMVNLRDELAAQGFGTDSGVYIEGVNALRRDFANQKASTISQIEQKAEAQASEIANRALSTAANITSQGANTRLAATQQQANLAQSEQEKLLKVGQALGQLGLNDAQVQSVLAGRGAEIGLDMAQVQAALAGRAGELGLSGVELQSALTGQGIQAAATGANILGQAGQIDLLGERAAQDVERQSMARQQDLNLARINTPANQLEQAAQLRSDLTQPIISAGLTGLPAGIASTSPAIAAEIKEAGQLRRSAGQSNNNILGQIQELLKGVKLGGGGGGGAGGGGASGGGVGAGTTQDQEDAVFSGEAYGPLTEEQQANQPTSFENDDYLFLTEEEQQESPYYYGDPNSPANTMSDEEFEDFFMEDDYENTLDVQGGYDSSGSYSGF